MYVQAWWPWRMRSSRVASRRRLSVFLYAVARWEGEGAPATQVDSLEALVRLRTRELETARDAAQAAMESKARFLAHMSHEVRTPLSAVLGYADLLAEELRERGADDLLPDVEKIERAARQQLSLVNEALDLSKLEAGGAELHLTEFDAEALVREDAEEVVAVGKVAVGRGLGHARPFREGAEAQGRGAPGLEGLESAPHEFRPQVPVVVSVCPCHALPLRFAA